MSLKEEELLRAKEVAVKFECELKEITLKHTSVNDQSAALTQTQNFLLLSLDVTTTLISCLFVAFI